MGRGKGEIRELDRMEEMNKKKIIIEIGDKNEN
jgi:hypothetical protein